MNNILSIDKILKPFEQEIESLNENLSALIGSDNEFVKKIISHIVAAGGKRLRPAVVFMFSKALNTAGEVNEDQQNLAVAIELIHTATLIHDDVIDEADTRRNRPTISKLWDEKTAVIAGDYLLALAMIKLSEIKNAQIIKMFADALKEICVGEIEQNLQTNTIISIDEYIEKSKRKTALLFALAAKTAAILSGADQKQVELAHNYGMNFGIGFQIIDDVLNFNKTEEKPVLNDLKNGIITAPVIYASEEFPEIIDIVENETLDFEKVLALTSKSSGIKKTKKLADEFFAKALSTLDNIENSVYKDSLSELLVFCRERNY